MNQTTPEHSAGEAYPEETVADAPRRAAPAPAPVEDADTHVAAEGTEAGRASPKEIATLPPIPVLRNAHPTSPSTGEPALPGVILAAMILLLASAGGVALTYGVHWWAAAHPASYPTSANLIRWVNPDPGKWLSLTLEVVLAVVAALVAGFSGYVAHHAWTGWRWTRWGGVVAVGLNALVVALFSWWGLVGTALALVGTVLLFLPRGTEFFRQFSGHRGQVPPSYERPESIYYGRLPRFR